MPPPLTYSEGASSLPKDAPEWAISASERIRSNGGMRSLRPPDGVRTVLLHSCCAPCSGAMMEEMATCADIDKVVVFFYNPNIHPKAEYEIRKEENKKFCAKRSIEFVDVDYDVDNWYQRMKGMEFDPERGHRCTECFDMRMERAALYAHEHGFDAIATTNATSRWKDAKQVDDSGRRAADRYESLVYWGENWQTDEMTLRKYQISANERFYKQEYCGCSYSLRDSNDWRKANGIPKIRIGGEEAGLGERYFTDPLTDAAEESQDVVDEFFAQANELSKCDSALQHFVGSEAAPYDHAITLAGELLILVMMGCRHLLLLITTPWVALAFSTLNSLKPPFLPQDSRAAPRSPAGRFGLQRRSSILQARPFPTIPAVGKSATSYKVLEKNVLEFFNCLKDESSLGQLDELLVAETTEDSDTTAIWNDITSFYKPLEGLEAIERHLRFELLTNPSGQREISIKTIVVDTTERKAAVLLEEKYLRSLVVLSFARNSEKITRIDWGTESRTKSGAGGLKVLAAASKLLPGNKSKPATNGSSKAVSSGKTPPEQYYDAWNARDIEAAVSVFTADATYDDTAFAKPLCGADAIQNHLNLCSEVFPATIQFQSECVIADDSGKKIAVEWHVANNDEKLPFTKGLSLYELENGKIKLGIDFVDGTPIKTASVERWAAIIMQQIAQEPVRLVPWAAWLTYMYVVFFSDGILPGANALQLEERTWKEVIDLSLNFFLVSPTLGLPFSPEVHPMLEAVFNLLLAWAALFVGFASDDRRSKPSIMPFGPTVLGMQFLTSAFYLPYLATRTTESTLIEKEQNVDNPLLNVAENRFLAPPLLLVGLYSIAWGFWGRTDAFGHQFQERWSSFVDLLSIDRVGSSFLVDLAIFGLFQSWWIDDDLKRRGVEKDETIAIRSVGKFLPFFGLGIYLMLRPELKTIGEE